MLIRRDWCISAWASTVLVGITYLLVWLAAKSEFVALGGAAAIGVAYAFSVCTFLCRVFYRLPRSTSTGTYPILHGSRAAFVGGFVYGGCIAFGVTLACFYVVKPTWSHDLVTNCLIAQLATMFACGFLAVPVGVIGGLLYLFRVRSGHLDGPRH